MKGAIFYGALLAVVFFLWYCLEYAVGLHGTYIGYHEYVSYFFSVPLVILMSAALRYRARQGAQVQHVRFSVLLAFGMLVSLTAGFLVIPAMYVFVQWVNPGFLDALSQYAIQERGMNVDQAALRFATRSFLIMHGVLIFVVGSVSAFVISIIRASRRSAQSVQTV